MASSGMLRRVALVRIDVSEGLSASFIRVTRVGEPYTFPRGRIMARELLNGRTKYPLFCLCCPVCSLRPSDGLVPSPKGPTYYVED
jgi:hypothetical protein